MQTWLGSGARERHSEAAREDAEGIGSALHPDTGSDSQGGQQTQAESSDSDRSPKRARTEPSAHAASSPPPTVPGTPVGHSETQDEEERDAEVEGRVTAEELIREAERRRMLAEAVGIFPLGSGAPLPEGIRNPPAGLGQPASQDAESQPDDEAVRRPPPDSRA